MNNIKNNTSDKEINVLSLFSGCGGMDLGFEGGFTTHTKSVNEILHPEFIDTIIDENTVLLKKNRFKTVFANDILKEARFAWVNFFSKRGTHESVFHFESIVDLVKKHKEGNFSFPNNIDVVTGGFPCQDFSVAGKRKGFDSHKNHKGEIIQEEDEIASEETRGKLYMWMKEVIAITKPKIFIAENVKGLVSLSNVKEIIQKDFSSADADGYIVLNPKVLHAADFGVAQSRERVIFIGIRKSALKKDVIKILSQDNIPELYDPYPKPTHSYNFKNPELKKAVTLKDIFEGLEEPNASIDESQRVYSKAKYLGRKLQGQTEVNMNGIGPTIRSEHHGNIEFRRLSSEHGGKNLSELEIGLEERRLTPRECALIQSFPKEYEFVICKTGNKYFLSPSGAYKVIGNAVPPVLAFNIARRIENIWSLYFD